MKDEWETLRKNVSKILEKDISIENVKHIAAVINVMENAGVDFKMPDKAAYPQTTLPVKFRYDIDSHKIPGMVTDISEPVIKDIRYSIFDSPDSRSKQVTFEITDEMLETMEPQQVAHTIHHELVAGIYKALMDKVRWLKPWGKSAYTVTDKASDS